jgi:hypothetical protein
MRNHPDHVSEIHIFSAQKPKDIQTGVLSLYTFGQISNETLR